jgi:hypothetical protein
MATASRPWLYPEVVELKRLAARRLKDAAIGRRLGRSPEGIRAKRIRLGLRVNRRHRANDALIRRLARDGWYDAEIAERLGSTSDYVSKVRYRLGITAGRFAPEPRRYRPDAA